MLPREKDYCIILYEDRTDKWHWTTLSEYSGLYEHFEAYGAKPDSELRWISEKEQMVKRGKGS